MRKVFNKKKGVAGLDVVESVILSLLVIGIIAITTALILYSILPSVDTISTATASIKTVTNESGFVNVTGYTLAQSTLYGFASPTITKVYNATSGLLIASGNYTLTGNVVYNASATPWNSALISYTYKTADSGSANIIYNITNANTSFFGNSSTFFSILAVVVIIALISLILFYIKGFRGNGQKATA